MFLTFQAERNNQLLLSLSSQTKQESHSLPRKTKSLPPLNKNVKLPKNIKRNTFSLSLQLLGAMTEVLHTSNSNSSSTPSPHFPPSPSPSPPSPTSSLACAPPSSPRPTLNGYLLQVENEELEGVEEEEEEQGLTTKQLSLLALLLTLFRKSLQACRMGDNNRREQLCAMEIGWPTDVRHVAHVTFDRFNGFLGLPVELEPEVPRRPPSASTTVFGVSTDSMQLSYDSRGNCVPTILLLMQKHLYDQGGLQAEGIFRINAENSQEESVRDQLNSGVVADGIDVHCLAGLIKAWFRELPTAVLDSLSQEQVMQCQTEEECTNLVRLLPPTEAALLDWAINLMADVVQQEHMNKMNARNIAMVFAPNMTQMADPLTALMYAVQVMNFLKTLILRTLREREDSILEPTPASRLEPFDENGHESPLQNRAEETNEDNEKTERHFVVEEPSLESSCNTSQSVALSGGEDSASRIDTNEENSGRLSGSISDFQADNGKSNAGQSSNLRRKAPGRVNRQQSLLTTAIPVEKTKGISNLSRLDSRFERIEAWR